MLHLTKVKVDYQLKASGSVNGSLRCNLCKMLSIEKLIDYQRKFNKWDKMTNIVEEKYQK